MANEKRRATEFVLSQRENKERKMNVLRALIANDEISLTVANTTELCKAGADRHHLSGEQAEIFARAVSFATFMSSSLKEKRGEVSLSLKTTGKISELGVSGNEPLDMRGYLDFNESGADDYQGYMTVVRDDGYNRPFVGACEFVSEKTLDENFEEYYRISEQLPTFLATAAKTDEFGELQFSAIIVLQPLPFASEESLKAIPKGEELIGIAQRLEKEEIGRIAKSVFGAEEEKIQYKQAGYRCHCSRERLKGVMVSVGKEQFLGIIEEEGEVRAHCHYCNTDYVFGLEDVKEIFPDGE